MPSKAVNTATSRLARLSAADPGLLKHKRLAMAIERAIRSGRYGPGDKLPSHQQLMREYGCSCATVTRAMQELVAGRLVRRESRRGTFVSNEPGACDPFPADHPAATTLGVYHGGMPPGFHPYYSALVEGYFTAAQRHGMSIKLIANPSWDLDVDDTFLDRHGFRGFVTRGIKPSDRDAALERRIPFVVLSGAEQARPVTRVYTDSGFGYAEAFRHLRSRGHARVACLHPRTRGGTRQAAAEAFDCVAEEAPIAEIIANGWDDRAAARGLAAWRELQPRPTAMLVSDDFLLKRLLPQLEAAGVEMPLDLAVVGVGSPLSAGFVGAAITMVESDPICIGATAVDLLMEQALGTSQPGKVACLKPELVVRSST